MKISDFHAQSLQDVKKGMVIFMELMDRVMALRECGMMNEVAFKDILYIIKLCKEEYQLELTEENAGIMITHMSSAFRRNDTGEEIDALCRSTVEEISKVQEYVKAKQILDSIILGIENELSQNEREYFLIHICNLLVQY